MEKKAYVAPTVEVIKLDNIYTGLYDSYTGARPGYFFKPGAGGGSYVKKD